MQRNWKHVLPLAVTSLGLFTSALHADTTNDSAQMRNLENRINALEQRKGAGGMINPQGRPQVRDGADVFIFADLLYWNAHQNGMNVAVKQEDGTVPSTEALNDSSITSLRGKWNWGFRTGLGYNTMHDGWDLKLTWLRFTDTSHKVAGPHDNHVYYPTQAHPDHVSSTANKVRGYWSFNLNQLDLDMGREFFVSKWLTLRPHVGLRTDWIHQKFDSSYYHVFAAPTTDSVTELKDHFWGIGLAGGLDTQWGLGNGWSIFGNAAAAIIYGFHQIHDEQTRENIHAPHNETEYMNLHHSSRISHPVLDLAMGLRWDYMFCKDRFHLGFDLGWEHHVYFSQNQFPLFVDDINEGIFVTNQGDLTMQGWTFSARFDF